MVRWLFVLSLATLGCDGEVVAPDGGLPGGDGGASDDGGAVDASGAVDVSDVLAMLSMWDTPDGDLTGDGLTNVDDLLMLLAAWGGCG